MTSHEQGSETSLAFAGMLTFVSVSRRARLLLSALLFGAGVAAASTALLTYFTRYSRFDSLIGEIDAALYAQITEMAPAEEVALVTGALLIAAALVVLVSMRRRASAHV